MKTGDTVVVTDIHPDDAYSDCKGLFAREKIVLLSIGRETFPGYRAMDWRFEDQRMGRHAHMFFAAKVEPVPETLKVGDLVEVAPDGE